MGPNIRVHIVVHVKNPLSPKQTKKTLLREKCQGNLLLKFAQGLSMLPATPGPEEATGRGKGGGNRILEYPDYDNAIFRTPERRNRPLTGNSVCATMYFLLTSLSSKLVLVYFYGEAAF